MTEVLAGRVEEPGDDVGVHPHPKRADVKLVELGDIGEESVSAGSELGVVPHHTRPVPHLEVVGVLRA